MNFSFSKKHKTVLAIDPSTKGFGFAILEGPNNLVDWGTRSVRGNKNIWCLMLIEVLIERYQPDVIVVEDCKNKSCRRSVRVKELIGDICKLAKRKRIKTRSFSQSEVRAVFSRFGALTKHQIATVLAERLPELAPRLPRFRKAWMSEDDRMSIFDAVALGLTFYYLEGRWNKA